MPDERTDFCSIVRSRDRVSERRNRSTLKDEGRVTSSIIGAYARFRVRVRALPRAFANCIVPFIIGRMRARTKQKHVAVRCVASPADDTREGERERERWGVGPAFRKDRRRTSPLRLKRYRRSFRSASSSVSLCGSSILLNELLLAGYKDITYDVYFYFWTRHECGRYD